MRVLGIDPGSRYLGLGCIEIQGTQLSWVGHRAVKVFTERESESDWFKRLGLIYASVDWVLGEWKPKAIAVEEVFLAHNASSALKLGQARGAALVAGLNRDLPIFEYSATEIKQTVTGAGRADKQQVQKMVKLLLRRDAEPLEFSREDASDALAIAICHAQRGARSHFLKARRSELTLR